MNPTERPTSNELPEPAAGQPPPRPPLPPTAHQPPPPPAPRLVRRPGGDCPRRFVLLLLALGGGVGLWALPAVPAGQSVTGRPLTEEERQRALTLLKPGQGPEDVRRLLGVPRRICRQILNHRYLEQWVYEGPYHVRVEFDWLLGQRPRLTAYVPTSPENR